jgi:acetyl/propionyl-CoA carboxylase alpha subunit
MNEFVITLDGKKKKVLADGGNVFVDGKNLGKVVIDKVNGNFLIAKADGKIHEVSLVVEDKNNYVLGIDGLRYSVTVRTKLEETAREVMQNKAGGGKSVQIKAPMPGMILSIRKKEGEEVKIDEALFILEAMKMENEIRSVVAGKVTKIFVEEGKSVEKNQVVMTIE